MNDDLRLIIATTLAKAIASVGAGHTYTGHREAEEAAQMLRAWVLADQAERAIAREDEDAA